MSKIPEFNADLRSKEYFFFKYTGKKLDPKNHFLEIWAFFVGKTVNKDVLCWFIFLNFSSDLISAYNSVYFFTS
jgi:hypothetical protein